MWARIRAFKVVGCLPNAANRDVTRVSNTEFQTCNQPGNVRMDSRGQYDYRGLCRHPYNGQGHRPEQSLEKTAPDSRVILIEYQQLQRSLASKE